MVTVIDYGVGNLFSLRSSFSFIGEEVRVTGDIKEIRAAKKLVLPGVGAFGDAALKLRETGIDRILKEKAADNTPIMGICLGMQLLSEESYEYGKHKGLGLIGGKVRPIKDVAPRVKIPQIGWNSLVFYKKHPVFKYVSDGDFVYFVHSYFFDTERENVVAATDYGSLLTAAVATGSVVGCQFHPEKSGKTGLSILRGFCEWEGEL